MKTIVRRIGLVAHDAMKKDMIEWVLWNSERLIGHKFYCTGTTGTLIKKALEEKHPEGEFYQFNLSSCIRQQNSLTAQFVSFSLANLANIFYPPPRFLQ